MSAAAIIISIITAILAGQPCSSFCCICPQELSCHDRRAGGLESDRPLFASVEGRVLGDVIQGSRIDLFRVSSTRFEVVMEEIRARRPLAWALVNETKGFRFDHVWPGHWAFVIPSSRYNGSIGAPLPYEFECENISLDIAFQGGDVKYAVGAFWINETPDRSTDMWNGTGQSRRAERGGLYKECPFG